MTSRKQATPVTFMGTTYPTVADFQKEFPKFATDDTLKAVRAGCDTPFKVEMYFVDRKAAGRRRLREAAQNSQFGAKFVFGDP